MNRGDLRFIAVGDVHPNREHPDEVFQPVADIFATGNLRYCQVECTFSSAGSLRTDVRNPAHRVSPHNVKALRAAAFDVASFASNNALDYGVEPFVETIDRMTEEGITVVGAGRNLAEARRPSFVERNGVRLAFVNACSLLRDGYAATSQRPGMSRGDDREGQNCDTNDLGRCQLALTPRNLFVRPVLRRELGDPPSAFIRR